MIQVNRHTAAVVLRTLRRRGSGVFISDSDVLTDHPQLPGLDSELNRLNLIAQAIENADIAQPFVDEPLTAEQLAAPIQELPLEATCIAGYLLLSEISRGGQAVVYLGKRLRDDQPVAIKIIYGGPFLSPSHRQRFIRECAILKSLQHPHVVKVHEHGQTDDGSLYLVMDYVRGCHIDQWVDKQADALTPREIVKLFIDVIDAVAYVHTQQVIHRDLKPANILVDEAGQVRVLDFGLSRITRAEDETSLTVTGQFVGSFAWASPEQVTDPHARPDEQSDVYSLGLILVRLLTGNKPQPIYPHMDGQSVIEKGNPVERALRQSQRKWVINASLKDLIAKAVSLDKSQRQADAVTFARELQWAIDLPAPAWWIPRLPRLSRQMLAVSTVAVLLMVSTIGWGVYRQPSTSTPAKVDVIALPAPSLPEDPIAKHVPEDAFRFGGHTYAFVKGYYSWDEANQLAKAKGGNLVTINTDIEGYILRRFFLPLRNFNYRPNWWIGLDDQHLKQGKWADGTPVDYTFFKRQKYDGPAGDRGVCTDLLSWYYQDRTVGHGYIIEWPRQFDRPFAKGKPPEDAVVINGRAYKHINRELTWDAARAYCEFELHGSLAIFHTLADEKAFLQSQGLDKTDIRMWIGGLSNYDHSYYWLHDLKPEYENWIDKPPKPLSDGIKLHANGWTTERETQRITFICMWPAE